MPNERILDACDSLALSYQQRPDQTVISLKTGADKNIIHSCRFFSMLKMSCMLINTDFMSIPGAYMFPGDTPYLLRSLGSRMKNM